MEMPTFHGNRRKACRVVRWMSHLPQNCRRSVSGGVSVVSYLAHLPWKSAESMPGGAMMVSPSTELPRKCGRWEVCGIFSCPPSMEISGKHARWGDGCPTFHRIAAEVWQVGRLGYFILPTFHGNQRKACQVVQ